MFLRIFPWGAGEGDTIRLENNPSKKMQNLSLVWAGKNRQTSHHLCFVLGFFPYVSFLNSFKMQWWVSFLLCLLFFSPFITDSSCCNLSFLQRPRQHDLNIWTLTASLQSFYNAMEKLNRTKAQNISGKWIAKRGVIASAFGVAGF